VSPDAGLPRAVLLISHDSHNNGAQRALVDTAAALCASGVQVHVLLPPGPPGSIADLFVPAARLHLTPVPLWIDPRGRSPKRVLRRTLSALAFALRVALTARRVGAELVVSNTAVIASGWLGAVLSRRPHVWWLHERLDRDDPLPFLLGTRLTARVIARTGAVVVPSQFLARDLQRWIPAAALHVVPPHMPGEVAALHDNPPVRTLLFPGGTLRVKRPEDALEAYAALRQTEPGIRLRVVGPPGPQPATALALARDLGLDGEVRFEGHLPDLKAELGPDVVVLSTGVDESFGRVLVEAMLAGSIVVGAEAGATPEVLAALPGGLLYRARDTSALAETLGRVVRDDDLRTALRADVARSGNPWGAEQHVQALGVVWEAVSRRSTAPSWLRRAPSRARRPSARP
jgi:glycosyltransferase involved in cell wall biosynthesis